MQEGKVAADVGQRDHGGPGSDQRVVRVVPFGPLGVEPDARAGHEVGQLGQERDEKFLREIRADDPLVPIEEELALGAVLLDPGLDRFLQVMVEDHGVFRIGHQAAVATDAVGDVGVGEDVALEQTGQAAGIVLLGVFEQLEQVDDLVVAPISDTGPGVMGLRHFPIDAPARDPVGVVAVRGRSIEEPRDHARGEAGERLGQGLPVLENVPPIALIIEHPPARRVPGGDGEAVPRPARVAVAPAEGQGQVFTADSLETRVGRLARRLDQLRVSESCGQAAGQAFPARDHGGRGRTHMVVEIAAVDFLPVGENAPAHHIAERVGVVPRGSHGQRGDLQPVGAADDPFEFFGAFPDVGQHLPPEGGRFFQGGPEPDDIRGAL